MPGDSGCGETQSYHTAHSPLQRMELFTFFFFKLKYSLDLFLLSKQILKQAVQCGHPKVVKIRDFLPFLPVFGTPTSYQEFHSSFSGLGQDA